MDFLSFYSFIFPTVANNIFIYFLAFISASPPSTLCMLCLGICPKARMFVKNVAHIGGRERERAQHAPWQPDRSPAPTPSPRTYHARKLGRLVCTAVWAKSFRPALGDSLGSLGCSVACLPLFVAYI